MSLASPQKAAELGNGDVETAIPVESVPGRPMTVLAPAANRVLRRADKGAELLEQDDAVVVPLLRDVDRGDGHGPTPFGDRTGAVLHSSPRSNRPCPRSDMSRRFEA